MKTDCPYECEEKPTYGNLMDHMAKCPNRPIHCSECEFEGNKEELFEHVKEMHFLKFLEHFDQKCKIKEEESKEAVSAEKNNNNDRIGIKTNSEGKRSRIGETGKYYCGAKQKEKCNCCDGYCGPGNGCNCAPCM